MNLSLLIPLFLGFAAVFQAGMNRSISQNMGLAQAALINSFFVLLFSVILYFIAKKFPELTPNIFHIKNKLNTFQLWWLIPAFLGICFVVGLPWAFSNLGALKVTILLIASQMIASVLWDIFYEKIPLNTMKILGIVFSLFSVLTITLSKQN